MFNPAFVGEGLHRFSKAYTSECDKPLPFAALFIAAPIFVFEDLRETVKPRSYDQLHVWIRDNPRVRTHLPARARQFVPYVREAIVLLLSTGRLALNDGVVSTPMLRMRRWKLGDPATEIPDHDALARAGTLGRWFGRVGDDVTIFNMLGVKP
jgi:Family of unknown function (DUF6521)